MLLDSHLLVASPTLESAGLLTSKVCVSYESSLSDFPLRLTSGCHKILHPVSAIPALIIVLCAWKS